MCSTFPALDGVRVGSDCQRLRYDKDQSLRTPFRGWAGVVSFRDALVLYRRRADATKIWGTGLNSQRRAFDTAA
jgi:hypothetical protein